eukprot:SAG31_NODE_26779_length_436_cov_2.551929_1_plen_33_part_10
MLYLARYRRFGSYATIYVVVWPKLGTKFVAWSP